MSTGDFLRAFTGQEGIRSTMVLQWRMPRIVAALAFGAALGASGAIFQTLTRNALGSPEVLGFSTGSYTGVLVVTVVLGAGGLVADAEEAPVLAALASLGTTGGALLGGLLTAVVVYALAYRNGMQGFRLIIVGIAVAAMAHALNTFLLLRAGDEVAMAASIWGAGSLALVGWPTLLPVLVVLAFLAPAVAMSLSTVRQLELGDDVAASHGVPVERARRGILLVGVALVAVTTAIAGPIAFIALSAPQIARISLRSAGIPVGASAVVGAALLVGADLLAQQALPKAVPVGIVTVVIGGAYLVSLLVVGAIRTLRHRLRV
jgi:iron complex transport system permease protein